MFIGEYKYNIDEKGRLAVPVKFRSILKNGAIVTRGLDNCLFMYPKEEWEKKAAEIAKLPDAQGKARAYSRFMLAGAMDVEFDNQGRVNLPDYLIEFAKLKKKVIIAGLYNRLEIWDETAWQKFRQDMEKNSTAIAEGLGELGI